MLQVKKILAIHGLGGHSGWFKNLADELAIYGIELYSYDLPGFGTNHMLAGSNSNFIQGHIDSYQDWLDFVQMKYDSIKKQFPGERIAILGHSLGAVLACNLSRLYPEDFLILSVPGFKGAKATFNPGFVLMALWKYVFDKLILKENVFLEMPVSEKAKETPAMSDPLRVGTVTQNLLFEILKLHSITVKNVQNIYLPTLMIQINGDKVVDNKAQNLMFANIGSIKKTLKTYNGADHDWIWYDITKLITRDIVEWLS